MHSSSPIIIPRDAHCISRKNISKEALKVIYRLKDKGYTAYLAGGAVRDLLLKKPPNDYDVVTDATPEQIKRIFKNSRIIGRRFKLVHIIFYKEIIEVSTFRAPIPRHESDLNNDIILKDNDGLVIRDNLFGTANQDALRRDFSINALFYDTNNFQIIDYAKGIDDINNEIVKVIGDPNERFIEDPVRMIRAIRFAGSLEFKINEIDYNAIKKNAHLLKQTSSSRMYDELQKLFFCGKSKIIYELLDETNLIRHMFIDFFKWVDKDKNRKNWIHATLIQLDKWRNAKLKINPALMLSILFGEYHESCIKDHFKIKKPSSYLIREIIITHLSSICDQIRIPKVINYEICDIMTNQIRFQKTNEQQVSKFIRSPNFLSAFLYFKFSSKISQSNQEIIQFWDNKRRELL